MNKLNKNKSKMNHKNLSRLTFLDTNMVNFDIN